VGCMRNEQEGDRQEPLTPQEEAEIEAERKKAERLLEEGKDIRAGSKGAPFTPGPAASGKSKSESHTPGVPACADR